ncbi:MAG TPA: polysaccharide biosynthesis/export family protein [Blastocatellia bacterium]
MKRAGSSLNATGIAFMIIIVLVVFSFVAAAQSQTASRGKSSSLRAATPPADDLSDRDDQYFRAIYRDFYERYKLGPEDQLAIRVLGQPDYSLDQVTVSPVGRIYHPLLGDVDVAGLTVPKLTEKLTVELSQYIRDPRVSLSLLSANSAKIGVLGDVVRPGIIVMARPMTILDAITASGGVSDTGSKSSVTVLRQRGEGFLQPMKVNVKRILEGKASPEENIALQSGDTIIVHGNTRKKIANFTSMFGFGSFLWFIRGW